MKSIILWSAKIKQQKIIQKAFSLSHTHPPTHTLTHSQSNSLSLTHKYRYCTQPSLTTFPTSSSKTLLSLWWWLLLLLCSLFECAVSKLSFWLPQASTGVANGRTCGQRTTDRSLSNAPLTLSPPCSLSLVDTLTHESMTHTLIHTYMTHTCCLSIDIERVVDIWREREKERDRKREKEEEREKERERNVAPSQPIRKYD